MENLIEVKGLKKYFQKPRGLLHAVDDITFSLKQRETLGVVGESGCGKSTLGRVILHLLDITDGQIFYKGEDITHVNAKKLKELRRKMQIIFQDPFSSLDPRMMVHQIIEEPLINIGMRRSERKKKVEEMMELVGLAKRLSNSYPHELDGGRRQRIGIARALALNPEFIVCDEPVSALDVSIQAQIINLILDLQKELGLTYMFISHDLSVVKYISHNIMVMYLGQTVEMCPSDELFDYSLHPYTKALLSAVPIPEVGKNKERILLRGEITSPIDPKPGCRFAPRCLYAKEKCNTCTPELRNVRPGHLVSCHYVEEINGISINENK